MPLLREPERLNDTHRAFYRNASGKVVIPVDIPGDIYDLGSFQSHKYISKNSLLPIGKWFVIPEMWGKILTFATVSGNLEFGHVFIEADGSGIIRTVKGEYGMLKGELRRGQNGKISLTIKSPFMDLVDNEMVEK